MGSARRLAFVLSCVPLCAWGFQIETIATTGCHERLTRRVIEGAVWPNGVQRPLATDDDRALVGSLEFTVPSSADAWMLATLIGVRDNDLHGAALLDLPDLVVVHNSQESQDEHCLRSPSDDGDDGDVEALAECRGFILKELALALGDEAQPQLAVTQDVKVALRWETRELPLEGFGFHLGRAMHGLQDSFAHAFRSDDERRVLSVFNWVDPVLAGDYSASRDGWPHQSSFDHCDGDDGVLRRVDAAGQASQELFQAVVSNGDRASRLAAAGAVLDNWLALEPGCDATNLFCGKAELSQGCSSTKGVPSLAILGLLLLMRGRGRGRPARATKRAGLVTMLLFAPLAIAEEVTARIESPPQHFSVHAAIGASIDRGGGNLTLGGGLALGPHVRLRADVELNPWLDTVSGHLAPGALSVYGTFMWRWFELGRIELLSSISVGGSALLFRTPGAEPGSLGLFAGASMVRVGIRLGDRLTLELTPEAVVAVPSLKGVPLAYRQYRATAGLRWDLGG